jgi:hypothetical protein
MVPGHSFVQHLYLRLQHNVTLAVNLHWNFLIAAGPDLTTVASNSSAWGRARRVTHCRNQTDCSSHCWLTTEWYGIERQPVCVDI